MENNENVIVKQKSNKGVIIVLIILVLGLCSYIAYDKFVLEKDTKTTTEVKETQTTDESKNDNTTLENKTDNIDKEQILKEVTGVYQNVYKQIANADSYGGKEDNYYKNKYGVYFTDKGLNMLSAMFEKHTPIKDILSSIFNFQDQGMRTLSLVLATDDTAIATGTYTGEGDHTAYPEYIVFKKVDGVWKIDMFE